MSEVQETAAAAVPPQVSSDLTPECDLVMKGGITSGIVYPPVVQMLKDKYRFRSIGGTSAGAIAAAITAAAEFGRAAGGFTKLMEVQDELRARGFIVGLFNPTPVGKPLLNAALDVLERARTEKEKQKAAAAERGDAAPRRRRKLAAYLTLIRPALRTHFAGQFRRGAVAGAGIGLLAAAVLALAFSLPVLWATGGAAFGRGGWAVLLPVSGLGALLALAGAFVGGPLACALGVVRVLTCDLPQRGNCYGLVHGHSTDSGPPALTDWLADRIDHLAGIDTSTGECLTFGRLAGPSDQGVELKMVTTNLSHGRPYVLPFANREFFLFNAEEFRRLFPQRVVDYMVAHSPPPASFMLPTGFHRFPDAEHLPVIVATRMSLSFPLLIGAVPLHTVAKSAFERARAPCATSPVTLMEADLQVNWFSDGGISSNFPIHFFDGWLPSRPTFGINLSYLDPESFAEGGRVKSETVSATASDAAPEDDPDLAAATAAAIALTDGRARDAVRLVRANDFTASAPQWRPIDTLPAFVAAIFSAAQNYRDATQGGLPSYRERIVSINLAPDEGGLNLDMPPDIVNGIEDKGKEAGAALDKFDFEDHRWTRFLVLMAELEERFQKLPERLAAAEARLEIYADHPDKRPPSYKREPQWMRRARKRVRRLRQLAAIWNRDGELFMMKRPKPRSVLRVTPDL